MKRKTYRITSTAGHNTTRSAWNAALREMRSLVSDHADAVDPAGGTWRYESRNVRQVDRRHVHGEFVWTGPRGHVVTFTITKKDSTP